MERRRTGADWLALALLLVGGIIIPLVGWIIGVILLWRSPIWTTKEKIAATTIWPGGYLAVSYVAIMMLQDAASPTSVSPTVTSLVVIAMGAVALAPVSVVMALAVRMLRRTQPPRRDEPAAGRT